MSDRLLPAVSNAGHRSVMVIVLPLRKTPLLNLNIISLSKARRAISKLKMLEIAEHSLTG